MSIKNTSANTETKYHPLTHDLLQHRWRYIAGRWRWFKLFPCSTCQWPRHGWPLPGPTGFFLCHSISESGRDIFHGRLFNLIYIYSLEHSYTRRVHPTNSARSPFPKRAKRSFPFSRLEGDDSVNLLDLGRLRQRRFKDRERYLRDPISRVERYTFGHTAHVGTMNSEGKYRSLRSSSPLSFLVLFLFFFFRSFFSILFAPLSIIVMKARVLSLSLSPSNMRRAISRVCRETHGVENSRKCSCHRKCGRYSFTKLIISPRVEKEDERRRRGEILGSFGEIKLAVETFFLRFPLYLNTRFVRV